MKKSVIGFVMLLILTFSITKVNAAPKDSYVMHGGDVLNIQVFDNPDLSSPKKEGINPYVVRPDGIFSMPLIGDVYVNNRSTFEVTNELIKRLSEYIRKPIVTINVINYGATRVFVLGEIRNQGLYELKKGYRLTDAISAAGGYSAFSDKKNIFVIRNGDENAFFKTNIKNLKQNTHQDVILYEGDCVYLTSNKKIDFENDVYPFFLGAYYISEATSNEPDDDNYKKNNISSNG